jgi:hypothetical protein
MASSRGKDIALIVGLLIPVAMILFIASAVYLPRVFSRVDPPVHDFLYMVGRPYGPEQYFVSDGHVVKHEADPPPQPSRPGRSEVRFYRHDVASNSSLRMTFEEAAVVSLDSSPRSPDGYEIAHGRRAELFFPVASSTDYRTRYLTKGSRATKLELAVGSHDAYGGYFVFLGWILEGGS